MKQKKGLPRLIEIAGAKKNLLILSGIFVVLHGILSITPYFIIYMILDNILSGRVNFNTDIAVFFPPAFAAVGISFFLMFLSGMASHTAAFNILYQLRCAIAQRIGELPMGYLSNRNTGELKKILLNDVERMESFIAHNLPDTIKAVSLPVTIIAGLFYTDWRLALVSIIPMFIFIVIIKASFGSKEAEERLEKYHTSLEGMNSVVIEFIRAVPVMKIFGQTASSFNKYSSSVKEFDEHVKDWTSKTTPLIGMVISFVNNALLPILIAGLYFYFTGSLDLSVLFLFLILGVGYLKPVFKLASMGPQITLISQGVKRIDEILFTQQLQNYGATPFPKDSSIEFKNVTFSYTRESKAINDLSLKIPEKKITALIGPSGSGKTTLTKLIPRFYDPESGEITIGGVNIKEISHEDLMNNIGFMFQENMIFKKSIFENILMGMDKSEKQVILAAKKANCHEFIQTLPKGYDTIYGEKGTHLSGGEKQRIQLARVILKNPPIVILDEATAFSDAKNERLILDAMKKFIGAKTLIIIAHKLSTIAQVPQIALLDKGKIQITGSHEDLMETNSLYQKMWEAHKRSGSFQFVNTIKSNASTSAESISFSNPR